MSLCRYLRQYNKCMNQCACVARLLSDTVNCSAYAFNINVCMYVSGKSMGLLSKCKVCICVYVHMYVCVYVGLSAFISSVPPLTFLSPSSHRLPLTTPHSISFLHSSCALKVHLIKSKRSYNNNNKRCLLSCVFSM